MNKPSTAQSAKAALRVEAFGRRDGLGADIRAARSAAIASQAIAIAEVAHPDCLAAYLPIRSECDPGVIVAWALANNTAVALPAVTGATTMVFRRYRQGDTLGAGGLGTLAPPVEAAVAEPDLIILPAAAFDRTGARLGHGRGYYDRAIAALRAKGGRPLLIGVAFAVQEVARIPTEANDIGLDWIVTEAEALRFGRHS